MNKKTDAIIVAAGRGTRMGADVNKVFLKLLDKEMLAYTLDIFENNENIDNIIIVTRKQDIALCQNLVKKYGFKKILYIVEGGNTRQESVYNGLKKTDADFVCIHDGARALIDNECINNAIKEAKIYKAAALGVKCKDTLKISDENGFIVSTINRENTYQIQTPQVFFKNDILNAHKKAIEDNLLFTDDCGVIEHYGGKVKIVEGSYDNIKLTTSDDIVIAENILKRR